MAQIRKRVTPGFMHRLGLAVEDPRASSEWFREVLGAAPVVGTRRPFQEAPVESDSARAGMSSGLLWHGGLPLLLLGAKDGAGPIGRFLERWGPGLHSLAWEVDDMWTVEHFLRSRDLRITGVDIPGRHFFIHPADTAGLLLELTDTAIRQDARHGEAQPAERGGVVPGPMRVAWATAVVADAGRTASMLQDLLEAELFEGLPLTRPDLETTVDLRIGDFAIRLVTPRAEGSRYAPVLDRGPRLWSYALDVGDLDGTVTALEGAGVRVLGRDGNVAWTDPASTFGVPMEWVSLDRGVG
jgi:catechol 2,3-dioxygenase-like lactoylglutathione lyase family enzyme